MDFQVSRANENSYLPPEHQYTFLEILHKSSQKKISLLQTTLKGHQIMHILQHIRKATANVGKLILLFIGQGYVCCRAIYWCCIFVRKPSTWGYACGTMRWNHVMESCIAERCDAIILTVSCDGIMWWNNVVESSDGESCDGSMWWNYEMKSCDRIMW